MKSQLTESIRVLVAELPSHDFYEAEALLRPFVRMLPHEQAQSIAANRRPVDRALRVLVRVLLGYGLQSLTGRSGGEFLSQLSVDGYGRPQCAGFCFSFSHTPPYAVCALASLGWKGRLGVDVESMQTLQVDEFSQVFTFEEVAEIKTTMNPSRELIRRWTIKEAALKAEGLGFLADPLTIHTNFGCKGRLTNGLYWEHLPLDEKFWLTVASCSAQAVTMERLKAEDYFKLY